jgi:uncharacterized membrane protein/predicted DsbA family dithiol-disulfide isomerase
MERSLPLHCLRALTLAALAASAALLVDGGNHLCPFESDCDLVRGSWLGRPLGVPLPALGALAFGGVFALSLAPRSKAGRLLLPLALGVGLGGLGLIVAQGLVLGRLCPACLVIDSLAVVIALLAAVSRRRPLPETSPKALGLWASAAAALLALGVALGAHGWDGSGEESPVPPQIVALWAPDTINVVEIYDFECPHCRRLHPFLLAFLQEQGDRVRHVRLTVPMPAHKQARHASRAYLCAFKQGKGREMAERLITARSLAPAACEQMASDIGLSLPAYRSCLADPSLDKKLDSDLAWVREAHPRGLPVVWVQDQKLAGLRPATALEELRQALRKAEQRRRRQSRE